jgi:ribosomal protein S12 methylthiotransferase accessory factor YcaO
MEIDEDQAAIARAVEESLQNSQNQPSGNYDEEAELARILEMSKNMM